jgi:hypothetical protein
MTLCSLFSMMMFLKSLVVLFRCLPRRGFHGDNASCCTKHGKPSLYNQGDQATREYERTSQLSTIRIYCHVPFPQGGNTHPPYFSWPSSRAIQQLTAEDSI